MLFVFCFGCLFDLDICFAVGLVVSLTIIWFDLAGLWVIVGFVFIVCFVECLSLFGGEISLFWLVASCL